MVSATVSNLAEGDKTVFSVDTGDIDAVESNVIESGTTSDATHYFCNQKFSYRRKLTIDSSQSGASCSTDFPSGTIPDFPVLIDLSGDWLKTTTVDPVNGRIESDDGDDIIFRQSDEWTELDFEIEKYDGTNGTLVAWVKIPNLSHGSDTDIYMYYGNPCILAPPFRS